MLCLLKNTTFATAFHRLSDISKNVRTTFEILDTRLLDALCDAKTEEENDISQLGTSTRTGYSKWLWRSCEIQSLILGCLAYF